MEFDFENLYNEYENNILFLWNFIKKNKYIQYYKSKKIARILKERIIVKNTYFFVYENKSYVDYNNSKILELLSIMESVLSNNIIYNNIIDKDIIDLYSTSIKI